MYGLTRSVGRRLALAFAMVIATFLVVATVALWSAGRLEEADNWNTHTYKVLSTADRMLKSMINMETGARGYLLTGIDDFLAPWNAGIRSFDEAWSEAKTLTADNPAQQRRLDTIRSRHEAFLAAAKDYMALRKQVDGGGKTIADLVTAFRQGHDKAAMDAFRAEQADFAKAEETLLGERADTAASTRSANRAAILIGSLAAVAIAIGMGLWVTRSITGPIREAVTLAEGVAGGDLTMRASARSDDELGQLLRALDAMVDSLSRIVGQVRHASDTIATGSAQIASGNTDLSQRTEEQASALQQTAATMERLGTTVRGNADSARQANQLAQGAASVATQGGDVVGQVVATMQGISESGRKIGDIIGVIDGIAFQTNILALNAAVEAARAGEQGRGFAVVASEVRTLAQRSAEAARQIKDLIGRNVEQVTQGSALVDRAGATMSDIVGSVRRVSDIVSEITAATVEQSTGIGQIVEAVGQMDQVTQQNAALVEQSAAAAESLRENARQMAEMVAIFKVGSGPGVTLAAATGVARSAGEGSARRTPSTTGRVSAASGANGDWSSF